MKRRIVKLMAVSLCLAFGMSLVACGTQDSDSGNSAETENTTSAESEDTSSAEAEEEPETEVLTLEDGTEIQLTALEEGTVGIYGKYTCENDGSMWVFGGDDLAVAYTDENGTLGAYVCTIDFYQTETNEDGEYYLCAVVANKLESTTTCWYIMNVVDEDENTTGLILQDPGDEDQYVALQLVSDDTDDTADADDTTDTDSASE